MKLNLNKLIFLYRNIYNMKNTIVLVMALLALVIPTVSFSSEFQEDSLNINKETQVIRVYDSDLRVDANWERIWDHDEMPEKCATKYPNIDYRWTYNTFNEECQAK